MSAEHLERLTDRIYDAVVDPAQWRQVLADVAGLAGADEAMLLTADVVTGASDAIFHGERGLGAAADFEAYYSAINPLVRMADPADYLARWRPTAIRDEDILARVELESTEYYNDFLRPLGAEHGLYLRLDRRGQVVTNISLGRDRRRGRFERDSEAALAPAYPHLRRAVALRRRFRGITAFAAATSAALGAASEPTFLLDRDGRIVHANDAGERLLANGTVMHAPDARLAAVGPRAGAELATAIKVATRPGDKRSGAVELKGADGSHTAQACVLPLALPWAVEAADGPAVLVRVAVARGAARLAAAMDGFGLTPAERSLAQALIRGQSLRTAATTRGVSVSTIRGQLASLFGKTGARRQAELVALLTRDA
ncbi:helix-turn-helix transcriptional regulator [Sphingomonas bacterium]|uniref:helix-turn-helix transcriptional regulator n=1 Tax=Sphingomonas bacterium TaxID=1895847 RepID=UPI001575A047|nr:helix-turn-helix transcriptional regulator [Sphingomonas bacterium]